MFLPFDDSKSLEALENDYWGQPDDTDSGLVKRCHALRQKPLNEFTPDDCRLLLGQNIGGEDYLVALALKWLDEDPLLEAQYFRGDLLTEALSREPEFWERNPDLWWRYSETVPNIEYIIEHLKYAVLPTVEKFKSHRSQRDASENATE